MSKQSAKYYQMIKALRIQKQQSQMHKTLKDRQSLKNNGLLLNGYSQLDVAGIIDGENKVEMDEKDAKITLVFSQKDNAAGKANRMWEKFQQCQLTFKLSDCVLPIQKKISQSKDEKLIDHILEDSAKEKNQIQALISKIVQKLSNLQQSLTLVKQKAKDLCLQMQGYDKELIQLKANFDKEQKNINERSNKYKEEKSKDFMLKNISKEDMQMRKAMASRIKLNQQLDFGFQLQRRRGFNQAKQAITEKKKQCQSKLDVNKKLLSEKSREQDCLIAQKTQLQGFLEKIEQEEIYFMKKILKYFKNHSKGFQWEIKFLKQRNYTIKKQDLPDDIYKEDANFLLKLIGQMKKQKNNQTSSQYLSASPSRNLPFKMSNNRFHRHLRTQQDIINLQSRSKSYQQKQNQRKTTVYFDIQSQDQFLYVQSQRPSQEQPHFNFNSNSLKKIYQDTGEVISSMIKNKGWNNSSCKAMSLDYRANLQNNKRKLEVQKGMQQKIKAKYLNVRLKQRRDNMKKMLFGQP